MVSKKNDAMITFALKCDKDHHFDSWFQSSAAFDKLKAAGMIACPVCGSTAVEKRIMAPRVQKGQQSPQDSKAAPPAPPRLADDPQRQAMAELRRKIEAESDYVGRDFAQEARDMHDGLVPLRAIHGEAKPEEAKKLIEDGVPVAPLPFTPGRKAN